MAPADSEAPRRATARVAGRPGAWVQAVANVGWPVVAYATLGGHAAHLGISEIGEMGIGGGLVLGLLPLTLVAVLQIAGGARIPDDGRAWAVGVVAPPLVAWLASGGAGLSWVAFEIGALYLAALVSGYAWIVWVRPFSSGRYWAWPVDQRPATAAGRPRPRGEPHARRTLARVRRRVHRAAGAAGAHDPHRDQLLGALGRLTVGLRIAPALPDLRLVLARVEPVEELLQVHGASLGFLEHRRRRIELARPALFGSPQPSADI